MEYVDLKDFPIPVVVPPAGTNPAPYTDPLYGIGQEEAMPDDLTVQPLLVYGAAAVIVGGVLGAVTSASSFAVYKRTESPMLAGLAGGATSAAIGLVGVLLARKRLSNG